MDVVTCPPGTKTTQLRLLVKRTGGSRSRGGDLPRVPPQSGRRFSLLSSGPLTGVPTPRPSTIVPTGAGRHPQALPRLSHGREGEPGPQAKVNVNIASHHHARPMPPPRPLMTNRPKDDHGRPPARPKTLPPLPASDTGGSGDNLEATPVPPAHCPPAGKEACAVAPAGSLTALGCCAWPPGLQRPGLSLARPRAAAATPPPHSCLVDKLENSECLSPEFGIASGFLATLGDLDHVNSF